MGAGKFIAIIGGILGILTVALFYVLPEIFSFWRLETAGFEYYLGGFGFEAGTLFDPPEYAEDILLMLMFTLCVAGGAIAIIGGLIESKVIGIVGGIIMLASPIILLIALFIEIGDFEDLAVIIGLFGGEGLIMGSEAGWEWGIWISTYLAFGAGALGVIGGAIID